MANTFRKITQIAQRDTLELHWFTPRAAQLRYANQKNLEKAKRTFRARKHFVIKPKNTNPSPTLNPNPSPKPNLNPNPNLYL